MVIEVEAFIILIHRSFNFVELHLDNITSSRCDTDSLLPKELFKHCPNVTVLSLRSNYLRSLPPDIGRLKRLTKLCLTNNSLEECQSNVKELHIFWLIR